MLSCRSRSSGKPIITITCSTNRQSFMQCIVLAIIGHGEGINVAVAWLYVALRIAHSLVQATVNRVAIRFLLFASSSLCLMVLIFHAAIPIFDLHLHG